MENYCGSLRSISISLSSSDIYTKNCRPDASQTPLVLATLIKATGTTITKHQRNGEARPKRYDAFFYRIFYSVLSLLGFLIRSYAI